MRIKRLRRVAPSVVEAVLGSPDPTGYRAAIVDDTGHVWAESVPDRGPLDFEHHRFRFVFVDRPMLDFSRHRYWIGVRGPSGVWCPFEELTTVEVIGDRP